MDGKDVASKAVIFAAGSSLKTIDLPAFGRLDGRGVSQCASCDGPLFKGADVAVLGGGDSAMQEALLLADIVNRIHMVFRGDDLSGQFAYQTRIKANPKIKLYPQASISDIAGDDKVSGVCVDFKDGRSENIEVSALFIFVGLNPMTELVSSLVKTDDQGYVVTDSVLRTDLQGLFAAGTCRAGCAGRASAAAGEGATAAIHAAQYLRDGYWPASAAN